jgi:hypothetical protein
MNLAILIFSIFFGAIATFLIIEKIKLDQWRKEMRKRYLIKPKEWIRTYWTTDPQDGYVENATDEEIKNKIYEWERSINKIK